MLGLGLVHARAMLEVFRLPRLALRRLVRVRVSVRDTDREGEGAWLSSYTGDLGEI